jgi:hypothetical protein
MAEQAASENKQALEFEGQHDDETLLFTFRNHIIAMRKGFYMLLIPFLIASLPSLIWPGEFMWLWVALGGFIVGLALFMYHWMGWYFSVYIVTDQRVRQVTQKGFFGKSVIDLGISKIQNISYNVPGFSAAIFGFGTIVIQTYVGDLVLENIEHPGKTYEKLQIAIKTYGSAEVEINK